MSKNILNIITLGMIIIYIGLALLFKANFNLIIAFAIILVYQRGYKKVKKEEYDLYFKFVLIRYIGFLYFAIAEFITIYFFNMNKNGVGMLIIGIPAIVIIFLPILYNTYKLYK
ncbi:hypothetical protein [Clostridium sp.]|uniref:hypothetical protein n=1 Tax=Clostridium sp. TaxID=1506 RepID=UPI0039969E28